VEDVDFEENYQPTWRTFRESHHDDLSEDSFLNTIDARLIQRCAVGQIPCAALCDVTGEGGCNATDARLIQRYAVGQLVKDELHCPQRP
jgi:hypothetical protein